MRRVLSLDDHGLGDSSAPLLRVVHRRPLRRSYGPNPCLRIENHKPKPVSMYTVQTLLVPTNRRSTTTYRAVCTRL